MDLQAIRSLLRLWGTSHLGDPYTLNESWCADDAGSHTGGVMAFRDRPPAESKRDGAWHGESLLLFGKVLKTAPIYSKSNVLECSRAVNKTVIWSYKTAIWLYKTVIWSFGQLMGYFLASYLMFCQLCFFFSRVRTGRRLQR